MPSWKRVIISGSDAALNDLNLDGNLVVLGGATGSFTGSFTGDGTNLTGVTAEWDGSHFGDASITGSLAISGSGIDLTVMGGNVGIGTTSPTAKLQVKGISTLYTNNTILITSSAGLENFKITDDGDAYFNYDRRTFLGYKVYVGALLMAEKSGASLYLGDTSNASTVIRGGGLTTTIRSNNFGIATASPTAKLQVKGSGATAATTALLVQNSATTNLLTVLDDGNVGINTTSPTASSILDITSTTKGFLPPRMTSVQLAAIATPAAGLVVYDNTTNNLNYYNGSVWVVL